MKQPEFYFCQYGEDIVVSQLFESIPSEYIVLGSADPVEGSVTKMLYGKGWRGLHVARDPETQALIKFDRPRDIVIAKSKLQLNELANDHELNHVSFVALQDQGSVEKLKNNDWKQLKPLAIFMQDATGADELLESKGYKKIFARDVSALFSTQTPKIGTNGDLIYFSDHQNYELAHEQQQVLRRSLRDEKHIRRVLEQSAHLVPFAKLFFKKIDNKISSFVEKKQHMVPHFDNQAALQAVSPTASGLKKLQRSYADSIQLKSAGPNAIVRPFITVFWFLYRVVRKVGKILFNVIHKPKAHQKEQAS
jgi:hypothetical protein